MCWSFVFLFCSCVMEGVSISRRTTGSEALIFGAVMRMYCGWAINYETLLESDCVTLFDQGRVV